jgi:glycosyltransferase involved in cell wall biosynthesis
MNRATDGTADEAASLANVTLTTILLLTFDYAAKLGGVGTHVQELARGLKDAGYEVIVLAHASGESSVVNEQGVQVHFVGASQRTLSQSAQSSIAQNMLAYNQDLIDYAHGLFAHEPRKPDIIHYHHWFTFAAARQLGLSLNIPIIGTIHYLTYPVEHWWGQTPDPSVAQQENIWLQNAQNLIAVSTSIRDLVEQFYPATRGKIHIVRNSININVFQKSPLSAQAKRQLKSTIAKSGEQIVLFAGRVNPQKGLEALIDAAALVVERHPQVRYLIAGTPDSRDYLRTIQARIQSYPGLESRITFLGKVARQQLSLLYQVADLAVFPSIYEPFGLVAVEAMISKVPPIVTRAGGLAEIVAHERTGMHVSVHTGDESGVHRVDVPELAAAQLRLLQDEVLRQQLAQAGYDYVLHELTFTGATLDPLIKVFHATIQAYRTRTATSTDHAAGLEN